ncbi:MAG: peptidylprolyl isomerase [Flavobacteriaceae bacterium]|nr:peptidylprolyl isomerase [Flavobacteriaceae bacterium]
MKKVLLVVLAFTLTMACKQKYNDLQDGLYADFQTSKGDILVKLTPSESPATVANFVSLAEGTNSLVVDSLKGKKFYDGLVFHRVVEDFVIQGGDPSATGAGGPGYKFNDEPNMLQHDSPGILSMANNGPDTNGSQFFITHKETPWLDGRHTIFGKVVLGQSVVDTIKQGDVINKVEIIRVGKEAKKFDASKVFADFMEEQTRIKEEQDAKTAAKRAEFINKMYDLKTKAAALPSGLKIYVLEDNGGEKPKIGQTVKFNYSGFLSSGELFDSNMADVAEEYGKFDPNRLAGNGYTPIETQYSPDAPMIPGFREGMLTMKVGDKALLFIPSELAYGEQGAGGGIIPPNSELIFEVTLVGIVQ